MPSSVPSVPSDASAADPIVGIDLGTTYSLVAVAHWPPGAPADAAAPRVLPDEAGRPLCPSVVRFDAHAQPVVGYDARDRAPEFPRTTVASVKRLMGRGLRDAAPDLPFLSFNVVAGAGDTARLALPLHGDHAPPLVVSPQEVSAHILARLRDQASRALGVPVRRAVITVPAYFDDAQRQATRDAARLAGLDAVRIINEPTAAALAYGLGLHHPTDPAATATATAPRARAPRTIVVYDFGGGTFDVSVLRLTPAEPTPVEPTPAPEPASAPATAADFFQVLATAGDTHLGGDDLDQALAADIYQDLLNRGLIPTPAPDDHPAPASTPHDRTGLAALPPALRRRLLAQVEQVKIRLSSHDDAPLTLELAPLPGGPYVTTISRARLEALAAPLVQRTLDCCRRALADARRAVGDEPIAAVVLVGGSTRVPLVRRAVAEFFRLEPYAALDPEQVVALGAAVQGAILAGRSRHALLIDVVPLSLGIETVGGAVARLIDRNAAVPARARERFSTSVDHQTAITLRVVQGEREMADDCRTLGIFHLRGIPPMPAGVPRVEVEFTVDAGGVLSVSAVELRSGKRAALQVVPNHGLSRDEVERLERESFVHARADMARRRLADALAAARLDLHWIDRQLRRAGDLLAPEPRAQLARAADTLRALADRAAANDPHVTPDQLHTAKLALDQASVPLHEAAITQSLKADEEGEGRK